MERHKLPNTPDMINPFRDKSGKATLIAQPEPMLVNPFNS